jgi:Spy/CpxP family protein refolding chaperone
LVSEGIFRVSSDTHVILKIKFDIEKGKKVIFSDYHDINVAPTLIKEYLADLPEPVFLFQNYEVFLELIKNDNKTELKKLLQNLPYCNLKITQQLFCLLQKVVKIKENKMDSKNLAIVFSPSFLSSNKFTLSNMNKLKEETKYINEFIIKLIEDYDFYFSGIFEKSKDEKKRKIQDLQQEIEKKKKILEKTKEEKNKKLVIEKISTFDRLIKRSSFDRNNEHNLNEKEKIEKKNQLLNLIYQSNKKINSIINNLMDNDKNEVVVKSNNFIDTNTL